MNIQGLERVHAGAKERLEKARNVLDSKLQKASQAVPPFLPLNEIRDLVAASNYVLTALQAVVDEYRCAEELLPLITKKLQSLAADATGKKQPAPRGNSVVDTLCHQILDLVEDLQIGISHAKIIAQNRDKEVARLSEVALSAELVTFQSGAQIANHERRRLTLGKRLENNNVPLLNSRTTSTNEHTLEEIHSLLTAFVEALAAPNKVQAIDAVKKASETFLAEQVNNKIAKKVCDEPLDESCTRVVAALEVLATNVIKLVRSESDHESESRKMEAQIASAQQEAQKNSQIIRKRDESLRVLEKNNKALQRDNELLKAELRGTKALDWSTMLTLDSTPTQVLVKLEAIAASTHWKDEAEKAVVTEERRSLLSHWWEKFTEIPYRNPEGVAALKVQELIEKMFVTGVDATHAWRHLFAFNQHLRTEIALLLPQDTFKAFSQVVLINSEATALDVRTVLMHGNVSPSVRTFILRDERFKDPTVMALAGSGSRALQEAIMPLVNGSREVTVEQLARLCKPTSTGFAPLKDLFSMYQELPNQIVSQVCEALDACDINHEQFNEDLEIYPRIVAKILRNRKTLEHYLALSK